MMSRLFSRDLDHDLQLAAVRQEAHALAAALREADAVEQAVGEIGVEGRIDGAVRLVVERALRHHRVVALEPEPQHHRVVDDAAVDRDGEAPRDSADRGVQRAPDGILGREIRIKRI